MDRHHRLDAPRPVGGKMRLDLRQIDRGLIAKIKCLYCHPEGAGHFAPPDAEPTGCQHQNRIALCQHVRDSRFPSAMAIGDIDCRLPGRTSHMFQIGNQTVRQLNQSPLIDIRARLMHGLQYPFGHDRRTRDSEIRTALRQRHRISPRVRWFIGIRGLLPRQAALPCSTTHKALTRAYGHEIIIPQRHKTRRLVLLALARVPAAPYLDLGCHCRIDDDRRQHGGRTSLDDAASL